MDILTVKKDMKIDGKVIFKAGVVYIPKGTEFINGKEYLVYDTEIKGQEYLLPIK
jgi:hypothetical protein